MSRIIALLAALAAPALTHAQPLRTVAEASDYKATSKGADVIAFCEAVAKRSPVARLDTFGTSHEGRKLPLLVISDPPVATAAEAKAAGKLVVLAFANIHGGEVDGKEALLALARDLTDKKNPLLKDLVILLAPNLNADGNEKIDPKNRPGENGPTDGAGTRANAQGLDLNRDFVKLESPEIRALVKLVNAWEPALVIDCHTTNGSKHRYTLTYDGPRYPSTDTDSATWASGTLFPAVTKKVKAATGFDIAPYGNFNADRTKWETYAAGPRYGVQYLALRGAVCVLSESYSYAPFKERIEATKAFVTACFEVAAEKRKELAKVVQPAKVTRVTLRTQTDAFPKKLTILGFEEIEKDGKRVATDAHREYSLDFVGRVAVTESAELPFAYLVPASEATVIENLQRHGVTVEELREDIDLSAAGLLVTETGVTEAGFPKKYPQFTVRGKWAENVRRVAAGTAVVKTAQPLGALAAYLLEPESEDGLVKWGVWSKPPETGTVFPVLRLPKAIPLALGTVAKLPEARLANQPITEAQLIRPGGGFTFGFAGSPLTTGAWLDAEHFLQVKEGKLLRVEARTGKGTPFVDEALVKKSVLALKGTDAALAERTTKATTFRTNPDRSAFLFNVGSDLALAYFDGTPAAKLTSGKGGDWNTSASPPMASGSRSYAPRTCSR